MLCIQAQNSCDCSTGYKFGDFLDLIEEGINKQYTFYTTYQHDQDICIENKYAQNIWNNNLRKQFFSKIKNHPTFRSKTFHQDINQLEASNNATYGLNGAEPQTNNTIKITLNFASALANVRLCSNPNTTSTETTNNKNVSYNSSNSYGSETIY